MFILSEEVTRREYANKNAQNLQQCIRKDIERLHQQTVHEWYNQRAILRTWLLALAAVGVSSLLYICIKSLP